MSDRRLPRPPALLFLCAYTVSGFAGLVYEVTWTRLLTLHLGHTTAAASAVVGAFLLGLAVGAALGLPSRTYGAGGGTQNRTIDIWPRRWLNSSKSCRPNATASC